MARIQKLIASEGLSGGSSLMTNVVPEQKATTGRGLEALGAGISNFASVAEYYADREQKKEDFKTEADYRKFQLDTGQKLELLAEEMPEDGTGFHKRFSTEVYNPARAEFLAKVPERLRERYGVLLGDDGPDTTAWSIKAATRERDQTYKWYENQLSVGQEELQTAISLDPDAYETLVDQGLREIDASGLPETRKAEQRQAWTRMAQVSHLNKMLETRPEQVLRDLGADPRYLTPTTQFNLLSSAVQKIESGGKVGAVSPKGAIGLMQVMPGTAKDISRWLGDGLISKDMSDERIASIISNPVTNKKYGDFYLKKMIKDYSGKGGLEAALIAYNGGPGRAEEWIASGFDDSVLPKETRDYYKRVIQQLPSTYGSESGPKGDPANVEFVFAERKGLAKLAGQNEENLSTDLTDRVRTAFAGIGINKVKINSGFRSEADNARVGGAKGSQHKHGNAMDIDVSGYSVAERVNIIKALSAAGITGLGIGSNIIHADVGGRRAWGYAGSAGGGAVPKWAQEAIAEHLEARAVAPNKPVGVAGRYSGLPYADRQKYIAAADQQLTRQITEQNKATAVQKVELKTAMENEAATLMATGQSTGLVDDTAVSTILGEDDYIKWVDKRETALRTYGAKEGIAGMTLAEMEERLTDYSPQPGSPTFARDQEVQAAVEKEIERVTRQRTRNPAEAALEFPDVKAAWAAVNGAEEPQPQAVQEFVRLNLERQKEFGLKPGSEQPVPRAWAVSIGQSLTRIPELAGRNSSDVNASIVVMYDSLQKVFGEYTDEVIISALREYKGLGPNTSELLTGYMQAIQAGGDPLARLRQSQDRALDADQVEQSGRGFWGNVWDFVTGEEGATPNEEPAMPVDGAGDEGVNSEQLLRAVTTLENLGDEMTPEQEQSLIRRFGKTTVDAAKARIGSGN
jgi:uncharacterized protein YcbK (DUF882 family)